MSKDPRESARAAEAQAALDRVRRDSESLLGSSMGRAADHFGAKDAPEGDRIELWAGASGARSRCSASSCSPGGSAIS